MKDYTQPYAKTAEQATRINEGLRTFMLNIYNHMGVALAVTGIVAYFVGTSETLLRAIFGTPLQWVVIFAPLVMVFVIGSKVMTMAPKKAALLLYSFAALMGLSISYIFAVYTTESIASTFFMTSAVFGGMSLYGYTTKRDLTGWGSFLFMGVLALVVVSIVNIFLQSSMLGFAVSFVGVFLFVGLTAYDTQRLKNAYYQVAHDSTMAARMAVSGALSLYIDFINLFLMLLRFFGQMRNQ